PLPRCVFSLSHFAFSLPLSSPLSSPTSFSTLSLHDALPIFGDVIHHSDTTVSDSETVAALGNAGVASLTTEGATGGVVFVVAKRSEEHTSELQSRFDLVCRLLLEKKKKLSPKEETRVAGQLV